MKIVYKEQLEHKQLKNHVSGELYSFSSVVSEHFQCKQVFLTHDVVAPKTRSSSPHRHTVIEEIVFISKGQLTLMCGQEKQTVNEGSFIFFNPNDQELHYLINETDRAAETITFSVKRSDDVILYADSKPWTPPTIETSRLILRPLQIEDAQAIFAYAKNPNVSQYTLWETHKSVEDSISYIQNYVFDYYNKGVPEPFGITLKENPKIVIGTVGCFWVSKNAKTMELAYAVDEKHWGKGIAAEAAQAVTDYCFKEFSLKRIQARCKTENKPSARVMEKIGMSYEGILKSSVFHRNRFWDISHYAKVVE